jgi:Na+-driven multidrug efflux pump
MNARVRKIAVPALRWAVGLVVLLESLKLAFGEQAIQHFARTGMPPWLRPVLAWPEIVAAVLFLLPWTRVAGGYVLLVVFAFAGALHLLHGQFDIGVLVVYATAVLVSMAYGRGGVPEAAHDRP